MKKHTLEISYLEYESEQDLTAEDRTLIQQALQAANSAYAPYSGFHVGAAVLLENNLIITGNNQENAAYPSGLCAERVALFAAASQHPGRTIKSIAIVAPSMKSIPVSPCGSCRQVMAEYEHLQKTSLRILLVAGDGKVLVLEGVRSILPFIFDGSALH